MEPLLWGNWAATFTLYRPLLEPKGEQRLQKVRRLLRWAYDAGIKIRLTAALHSWNPLGEIHRVDIGLSNLGFNQIHGYDAKTQTVTTDAGVHLGDLIAFLAARGRQLATQWPNFGLITVGGAVATAANQNYVRAGTLSSAVAELQYVTPHCVGMTYPQNREFSALVASAGQLAFVSAVTLQTRRLTWVKRQTQSLRFDQLLRRLQRNEWLYRSDYLQVWLNPYSRRCGVVRWEDVGFAQTSSGPAPPPDLPTGWVDPLDAYLEGQLAFTNVTVTADQMFTDFTVPPIGQPPARRPAANGEYVVDANHCGAVLMYLTDLFPRVTGVRLTRPIDVGFVGSDEDILLSPARHTLNAYINIEISQESAWQPFLNTLQQDLFQRFRARPHMGKYVHLPSNSVFRQIYGVCRTAEFEAIQRQLHGDQLYRTW